LKVAAIVSRAWQLDGPKTSKRVDEILKKIKREYYFMPQTEEDGERGTP
jgi:hypothetical protein